jgi:hypothetical protein
MAIGSVQISFRPLFLLVARLVQLAQDLGKVFGHSFGDDVGMDLAQLVADCRHHGIGLCAGAHAGHGYGADYCSHRRAIAAMAGLVPAIVGVAAVGIAGMGAGAGFAAGVMDVAGGGAIAAASADQACLDQRSAVEAAGEAAGVADGGIRDGS